MMHPDLGRGSLIAVVIALLLTAPPALLHAQSAGGIGGDGSLPVFTNPLPSTNGVNVTVNALQIVYGKVLGGQEDVPPEEQLREPDKITFSATVSGTGGGPIQGGGQCNPTSIPLAIEVTLPIIEPHLSPPARSAGGQGGVVTVATWFWATHSGTLEPTSSLSGDYTTCSSHPPDLLGRTWWSPSQQTATIRLNSAPTGYRWDFGDRAANTTCADPGVCNTSGLGDADQGTIQHTYYVSSVRANHPTGYPVFVGVDFMAHASIDAGGANQDIQSLPVSSRSLLRYHVREVQAVLDE